MTSSEPSSFTAPDQAVRAYLEFVRDPSTARDNAAIEASKSELAGSSDLLEQLRLISQVERLERADGEGLRQAFVRSAKSWASANNVSVSAFRQLGVNDIVLAESGFDLGNGRKGRGAAKASSTSDRNRPRANSVSSASIREWALKESGSFTMAEVMAGAGGSLMTVKKVVSQMVQAQELQSLGQIAKAGVRGRAPEHFQHA